ncbi:MAG TPA: hypothetical protein VGD37_34965 [Kofleriaceae bacterium]|jgi:hypothetical protein
MTNFPLLAAVPAMVACTAAAAAPEAAAPEAVAERHYCNLHFFTPQSMARHLALRGTLVAAVTERRELATGYRITFPGSFREAGEFVDGIRGCCPTIGYALQFAPHDGTATLEISGGPGAKAFIAEEFRQLVRGQ